MNSSTDTVTLVHDAIHNPTEPRHFMRIIELKHVVTAAIGGTEIARSDRALKVKEVGRDIYDPVVYFPRADVAMQLLRRIDKSTHCPLKGDTAYFDADLNGTRVPEVGWSYEHTIAIAAALRDYIAFDRRRVHIVELTVES